MSDGKKHSRYGGSIAKRWLKCPGSVTLAAMAPPEPESKYAKDGTHAHKIAEVMLQEGCRTCGSADPEFTAAINTYLEEVWRVWDLEIAAWQVPGENGEPMQGPKATRPQMFIEDSFVLPLKTAAADEVFGANDCLIWAPHTGNLYVFDYKHGAGAGVDVEDNEQLKFYACGAVWSRGFNPRRVELIVVQPRLEGAEPVKRWEMPTFELDGFFAALEEGVQRCKGAEALYGTVEPAAWAKTYLNPDLERFGICHWCPAAAICPAKEAALLEQAGGAFTSLVDVTAESLPAPETLDYARLGQILKGIELISDWGAQIEKFIDARLREGETVPGWKLVEKIGRRAVTSDETQVTNYLSLVYGLDPEHLRPRALVTITEIKRLLKAALTNKKEREEAIADFEYRFTSKESSGLTMVREDSDRPGVVIGAADFASVDVDA